MAVRALQGVTYPAPLMTEFDIALTLGRQSRMTSDAVGAAAAMARSIFSSSRQRRLRRPTIGWLARQIAAPDLPLIHI